jgi:mannitol-specific phosphotransferase system IIBC component
VGYFYKNQDLFTLPELLSSPPVAHHISFLCKKQKNKKQEKTNKQTSKQTNKLIKNKTKQNKQTKSNKTNQTKQNKIKFDFVCLFCFVLFFA